MAIGRGGYLPARIVSDYLDVYDLASIRIEHYRGVRRERAARVRYPLTADVAGKRVLLIDDVSDSGDTFAVAIRHLQAHGEPAALRTAVLHHISGALDRLFARCLRDRHSMQRRLNPACARVTP